MKDVIYQKPQCFEDERGFFLEWYQKKQLNKEAEGSLPNLTFIQSNHSFSKKGTLRGLHWQEGQGKYLYVPVGEIFDVVVDLKTRQWRSFILSGKGHETLYIPSGYAHGFCVLSDEAHLLYHVTDYYDPKKERGCRYDDPAFGIKWPITNPILSKRDAKAQSYEEML